MAPNVVDAPSVLTYIAQFMHAATVCTILHNTPTLYTMHHTSHQSTTTQYNAPQITTHKTTLHHTYVSYWYFF